LSASRQLGAAGQAPLGGACALDGLGEDANTPRLYRNTLAFLAADKTRLQDLDEAARKYLAWKSILSEKVTLNLDPQQVAQAETQTAAASGAVAARLPETYQWLLVPVQSSPQAAIQWQAIRLSGQDELAVRASKKLRTDELLLTGFAATFGPTSSTGRRILLSRSPRSLDLSADITNRAIGDRPRKCDRHPPACPSLHSGEPVGARL
jgi:hypothetical protein